MQIKIISRKDAKANGLKRYFTGKQCKYGHVAERFCSSGRCSKCDKVLQKSDNYRAKRREYEQRDYMRRKRSVYNKTPRRKKSLSEMQKAGYRKNKPAYLMRLMVSRLPKKIRDGIRDKSTQEKLGYSVDDFKAHMECLFQDGMTWGNHGEWHVDHVIPVSKFPSDKIAEVNSLDNLQPLWAKENLSKGNTIIADKAD